MIARWWAATLLCVGAGCSDAPAGSVYIALDSDFADFASWTRIFVGEGPLEGHPAGQRYGYIKELAPAGSTSYPVGARIVKTVENGAPESWDVFAMAKRGAGYNTGGAVGWEYFTFKLTPQGVPVLFSRGSNPVDPETDGGTSPGYVHSVNGVTCNRCHGVAGTERTDHILSPLLEPGKQ